MAPCDPQAGRRESEAMAGCAGNVKLRAARQVAQRLVDLARQFESLSFRRLPAS